MAPGGVGQRPQDGVTCAACGRHIPRDQYADALCWAGPLDGATVAAHRACLNVYDEIARTVCPVCLGKGWVAVRDPVVGGFADQRCPDCAP